MWKRNGFTLVELLTVIAIIAIITAISVPGMISWMKASKMRSFIQTVYADLSHAKSRAIREGSCVVIEFYADRYMIFIDNFDGVSDFQRQSDETVIANRNVPGGLTMTTTFPEDSHGDHLEKARFRPTGRPSQPGSVIIEDKRGHRRKVTISAIVGRIRIVSVQPLLDFFFVRTTMVS